MQIKSNSYNELVSDLTGEWIEAAARLVEHQELSREPVTVRGTDGFDLIHIAKEAGVYRSAMDADVDPYALREDVEESVEKLLAKQHSQTGDETTQINELLKSAAEIIGGKAWGADKGKPRIYMPSRKSAKVYFDFPDYTDYDLGGAAFRVYLDDCGQHRNWYVGQRAKITEAYRQQALALIALGNDQAGIAKHIMEMESDFDAQTCDRIAHALENDKMIDEHLAE